VYLVDTDVVSALRRSDQAATAWLAAVKGQPLFISALTVGEIRRGIAKVRGRDPRNAARLEQWLAGVLADFAGNILPIDETVAGVWGDLPFRRLLPVIDTLIAATALRHGLAVVTRNVRDFAGTGVAIVDPWAQPRVRAAGPTMRLAQVTRS
jgi:predicted nucleic acid-binding protein